MKRTYSLCKVLFILTVTLLTSLDKTSAATALNPSTKTIFKPLLADPFEPRVAVMPWLGKSALQLDIGSSTDLYQNDNKTFAAGVDFGTYSLLRRKNNFKFPVDTVDYLFGINASWKKQINCKRLPFDEFSARARISHISAHFEDGHYDEDAGGWIQEAGAPHIPLTYSREFVNLVLALSSPGHRFYTGYQYLYHSLPDGINAHSFQAGAELSTPYNTYLAADFKLLPVWQPSLKKTRGHRGTWNLQAGIRLNGIGLEKVRVACNYYNGISRHGMYFYKPESYTTAGIIIDF
ncbi:MAG: DUF1207 domain-containing protein [Chlorobium sp.]|nr:MAG: DUF1207 domain-containing protein [Chlorobium sp.]